MGSLAGCPTNLKWYNGTGLNVMNLWLPVMELFGVFSDCARWYTRLTNSHCKLVDMSEVILVQ